jgi:hypothetical protein
MPSLTPSTTLPSPPMWMDQQQHDEPEEQQEPPAAHPVMSIELTLACVRGNVNEIRRLLVDGGENINSVVEEPGHTPIMIAMMFSHLAVVQMLADRGADLSTIDNAGYNLLCHAGRGGRDCIEWVFANTTIDVNSITSSGETPIMRSLRFNKLDASMLLVEKGANLFMKNNKGERAIDMHVNDDPIIVLGPQVLQHALDLRWASVRHLLLLSNFHGTSDFVSSSSSSHLAASVFTITGLVRHIAEYLIRTEIIVRERRDDDEDEDPEPDDVKRRIEAALAANEERYNGFS